MTPFPRLFRYLILAGALLLPVPLLADGFTCAASGDSGNDRRLEEPEEVASSARETVSRTREMQAWMRRLVGRYTVDGYVDLCGKGNRLDQRHAIGKLDCIEATLAADVHCKFILKWPASGRELGPLIPGDASGIAPAQLLFSFEHPWVRIQVNPDHYEYRIVPSLHGDGANNLGIGLVQVDHNGVGEYASGVLVGDTFLSREPCLDIPGDCHRITRVMINPESSRISMTIEVRVDRQRMMGQVFTMHRKPDVPVQPQ